MKCVLQTTCEDDKWKHQDGKQGMCLSPPVLCTQALQWPESTEFAEDIATKMQVWFDMFAV